MTNDMVLHYLLDSKNSNGLYHRIDPRLPRAIALDDVDSLAVSKSNSPHAYTNYLCHKSHSCRSCVTSRGPWT